MIEIKGEYTSAVVYSDSVDSQSYAQILELCNRPWMKGSRVAIMPDFHVGAGCVIGTTMTLHGYVEPNLVGVDIGCGVSVVPLKDKYLELKAIDKFIQHKIPHGSNVHKDDQETGWEVKNLICHKFVPTKRAYSSIGTLGGGNHYIEIDTDDEGRYYLCVHSGSRNLGKQVAEHYQRIAAGTPERCLYGASYSDYIHDMQLMQKYASINRDRILELIIKGCGLKEDKNDPWRINTIHNYVDTKRLILRKGAVSALEGEKLVIPMNMRDGALLCVGKGNEEWNFSSPHGAGRLYSRSQAKSKLTMEDFKKSMEGIYTSCISSSTIDEAPMAYKDMQSIISQVVDSVDIVKQITPVYNFKSSE